MTQHSRLHWERRARGLCVVAGCKEPGNGWAKCGKHRQEQNNRERARRAKMNAGIPNDLRGIW